MFGFTTIRLPSVGRSGSVVVINGSAVETGGSSLGSVGSDSVDDVTSSPVLTDGSPAKKKHSNFEHLDRKKDPIQIPFQY